MSQVHSIVTSRSMTYEQKLVALAGQAEGTLKVLDLPPETRAYMETGAIDDLGEGAAPYRPRYVMVDFQKFVAQGSTFLELPPPKNLDDLLCALQILYRHIPSITSFPVYLGNLDTLIEPFAQGVPDGELEGKLRRFLTYLDRTITDSFCHANLGPGQTRTGEVILRLARELQLSVPNLTLKYDPAMTSDAFAEQAAYTSLFCANPAFCNHVMNAATFDDYGISSCYNILPVGGGAYTLCRITLTCLAKMAASREAFLERLLPDCLARMGAYINERVRFLVEESGFFQSSFLVKEGLVSAERFLGMFGVTGLAECVDTLLAEEGLRYGRDSAADDFGKEIMERIDAFVKNFPARNSPLTGGRFLLHAQVGLDRDIGITSGVRIPVGEEPALLTDHLRHSGRFHSYFPTGCGDIFPFETTTRNNPAALVDVVKGAFRLGVRYLSFYAADSDLVRITGYLVKRSEMERYFKGEPVLKDTIQLGSCNYRNNCLEKRKVRS